MKRRQKPKRTAKRKRKPLPFAPMHMSDVEVIVTDGKGRPVGFHSFRVLHGEGPISGSITFRTSLAEGRLL